eukprot:TRINITY_DN10964_c0_g1_i1.p1 TRINITY_DN10964_c0_g1~~TRINITY_DN10964_c0_g1_i1.p1  ORF type:complete len:402 (-),score=82.83 TRINITY_DN10964_c0_g1_i1:75-1127(-)
MPLWPPMPSAPLLKVRVDGLKFDYQLTQEDVKKVFARYGEVVSVDMDTEGTASTVQFALPHHAMAAQHDLDRKQLAGMSGAFLTVEFVNTGPAAGFFPGALPPYADPAALAHMAHNPFAAMMQGMPGAYPTLAPPTAPPVVQPAGDGQSKKYTCKLEVGIENETEFRVGSRVIQIARQIWQDDNFQRHGGKTRLRGKGIGGPHEGDEPLALCISCKDAYAFDKALTYAENQLQKVHEDYKAFCAQHGKEVPELAIKITKRGTSGADGSFPAGGIGDTNFDHGERPEGSPSNEEIEKLIEERNEARKSGNFKKADEVRDMLKSRGVVLMDEKGAKGTFKGNEVTRWRFWRP